MYGVVILNNRLNTNGNSVLSPETDFVEPFLETDVTIKGPHHINVNLCVLRSVALSWLTLFNPMDCSPPGSSVHGIFQARILEWVAFSFSREPCVPFHI